VARWCIALLIVIATGAGAVFVAPGFLLEGPLEPLQHSDVIIVVSGDEALARYRDGIRLFQAGWAPRILFSGAAWDGTHSNADVMRAMAVADGVPQSAILVDPTADDTYGNAVNTRDLLVQHGLQSAVLVTSPYHLNRAVLTFRGVYDGTGIRVIGRSAPDGEWRKTNWWMQPETRSLTVRELEKLGYVTLTGRYN
jgi:uncharacterized SAM-binding protein YcdF (DUF218 family)